MVKKRPTWELRLYVAGKTPKSVTALQNLQKYCETHLAGQYKIEVIDLLVKPQLAEGIKYLLSQHWCGKYPNQFVK